MATIPVETISPTHVASALGFIMGVGEIVGGVAGPGSAGFAAEAFGPASSLWMVAGLRVGAGLLGLAFQETTRPIARSKSLETAPA